MVKVPLYNAALMEHYHRPRFHGILEDAHFRIKLINHSCGDVIEVTGKMEDESLVAIGQQGTGCIISQAYASILAEHVIGKSISYIESLTQEHLCALGGLSLGPNRIRCALMSWEALVQGIKNHARSH